MNRNKAFLIIQTAICALVAGLLVWSAVSLYHDGIAAQADGELFAYIYTREKVAAKLAPIVPLIFIGLGVTLSGIMLGIRDDSPNGKYYPVKPVEQADSQRVSLARVALIVLALTLTILGVLNGGLEDVMTKANAICMECVGLG